MEASKLAKCIKKTLKLAELLQRLHKYRLEATCEFQSALKNKTSGHAARRQLTVDDSPSIAITLAFVRLRVLMASFGQA